MEAILFFIIWAVGIFLMMRFGCGAHVMGHDRRSGRGDTGADPAQNQELRWVAPAKAVDPVCGRTVATDQSKPSVFEGDVYYFCSRQCREVFEAAPDIYLRGETRGSDQLPEHTHV